jgi:antitoxin component of RelBE/YafQ-DinJ toxin-antitoxin module
MTGFSDAEKKSIRVLEHLGIDTTTIIRVFVACERDESLPRKCLLSMRSTYKQSEQERCNGIECEDHNR